MGKIIGGHGIFASSRKGALPAFAIVAIIVAVILIALAVAFLPFRPVSINETRSIPMQPGVDKAEVHFSSDIADVKVTFANLSGDLIEMKIGAVDTTGLFSTSDLSDLLNVSFYYTAIGDKLIVTDDVQSPKGGPPAIGGVREITVELVIDRSLETAIDARTMTGAVSLSTQSGVELGSLDLTTTTGGVGVVFGKGTLLKGDAMLRTTTGEVDLSWNDVMAYNGIKV